VVEWNLQASEKIAAAAQENCGQSYRRLFKLGKKRYLVKKQKKF
jgi:hypothetical protein